MRPEVLLKIIMEGLDRINFNRQIQYFLCAFKSNHNIFYSVMWAEFLLWRFTKVISWTQAEIHARWEPATNKTREIQILRHIMCYFVIGMREAEATMFVLHWWGVEICGMSELCSQRWRGSQRDVWIGELLPTSLWIDNDEEARTGGWERRGGDLRLICNLEDYFYLVRHPHTPISWVVVYKTKLLKNTRKIWHSIK